MCICEDGLLNKFKKRKKKDSTESPAPPPTLILKSGYVYMYIGVSPPLFTLDPTV